MGFDKAEQTQAKPAKSNPLLDEAHSLSSAVKPEAAAAKPGQQSGTLDLGGQVFPQELVGGSGAAAPARGGSDAAPPLPAALQSAIQSGSPIEFSGKADNTNRQPDYYMQPDGQIVPNPKAPPHQPGQPINIELDSPNKTDKSLVDAIKHESDMQKKAAQEMIRLFEQAHPGQQPPSWMKDLLNAQPNLPDFQSQYQADHSQNSTPEVTSPQPGNDGMNSSGAGGAAPGAGNDAGAGYRGGGSYSGGPADNLPPANLDNPPADLVPDAQQKVMIDQALQLAGQPVNAANEAAVNLIVQHESGWNAHAENNWDSNAAAGHPSKGLMQTIDSTFSSNAVPGHTDIWNPVDNMAAGIRYAVNRYGSLENVPGVKAVAAGRPYVGY